MKEALKHLSDQPELWPRWKRGFRFDANGGATATDERHLFIFVREGDVFGGRFGSIYSACHFVPGADRIIYDDERKLTTEDYDPICDHCFEVELQHGVQSLTD